jgi:hypothetical protein
MDGCHNAKERSRLPPLLLSRQESIHARRNESIHGRRNESFSGIKEVASRTAKTQHPEKKFARFNLRDAKYIP